MPSLREIDADGPDTGGFGSARGEKWCRIACRKNGTAPPFVGQNNIVVIE